MRKGLRIVENGEHSKKKSKRKVVRNRNLFSLEICSLVLYFLAIAKRGTRNRRTNEKHSKFDSRRRKKKRAFM